MLELLIQTIINGLFIGFLFGLAGMGLTLIFGIMKLLNFAQGPMIMLGAYGAFWVYVLLSVDPMLGILMTAIFGLILGALLYRGLLFKLVQAPALASLLVLFGVSMILENTMLNLWSPNPRSIPVDYPTFSFGLVTISGARLIVSAVAILASMLLMVTLKWTTFGRIIRATVQDRNAATLMGVDVTNVYMVGSSIGIGLTLLSGGLLALIYPFEPFGGLQYSLYSFVVVVLGTLGNPLGCLLAGLIIGLLHSFTGSYWTLNMSPAVAYLILVLTLLFRPGGLMAGRD
ncbi:MAG: branched-chain amino acid ABC transporter permease [Candidatus Bathyarchaeota archaeon]|jgi:branched-subunit amino acid ABC-type transport system permease component|nr:branched-chain amino acid ABC transporter permease [Candidatus Bathyarchaeota archaeon]